MTIKNMFWQGEDFVEKIENVVMKVASAVIIALVIYAFVLS